MLCLHAGHVDHWSSPLYLYNVQCTMYTAREDHIYSYGHATPSTNSSIGKAVNVEYPAKSLSHDNRARSGIVVG